MLLRCAGSVYWRVLKYGAVSYLALINSTLACTNNTRARIPIPDPIAPPTYICLVIQLEPSEPTISSVTN